MVSTCVYLSPAQARKLEKQVERLQARDSHLRNTVTQLKAENLEVEKLKVKFSQGSEVEEEGGREGVVCPSLRG